MNVPALPSAPQASSCPLVVELDRTLVRTDTLLETLLLALKRNPLWLLLVPLWLSRGAAHLKAQLARRVQLEASLLPFQPEVLAFLRAQHALGRPLWLVTSADQQVAQAVAAHLGLFERVYASDGTFHLKGGPKHRYLKAQLAGPFDCLGASAEDLALWSQAEQLWVVDPSPKLVRQARALGKPLVLFCSPAAGLRTWVKAVRVHQWAKNILVFVPLLAAHRALELGAVLQGLLAFVSFSLCASSVYVLNDLLDLQSDRRHPSKQHRPFASGALPLFLGLWLFPVLLAAGAAVAVATLPWSFAALLGTYYLSTLAYSLWLKQVMVLDVLLLAGLYTVRLFGGSLAVGVPTSNWFLSFSMFLFFSLALVKRHSEVRRLRQSDQPSAHGRGYLAGDYEQLGSLGTSSGYLAVLVLALYITSDEVTRLYTHPERLWLLCPLMLYWVSRIWLLAHRGLVSEDPLIFALRDKASYAVGAVAAIVLMLAT